jgi:hypothetical protein
VDGLLDALTPLAALLARTADPSTVCVGLAGALGSGNSGHVDETLRRYFGADATWVRAALSTAGLAGASDIDRRIRLAQSEVLALEIQRPGGWLRAWS